MQSSVFDHFPNKMSVMFSFLYTQYIVYAIDKFIYSINIIIHGIGFFLMVQTIFSKMFKILNGLERSITKNLLPLLPLKFYTVNIWMKTKCAQTLCQETT